MFVFRILKVCFTILLIPAFADLATSLPAGETLLTLEIKSSAGDTDQVIDMTQEDLRALPAVHVDTSTIWTDGVQHFLGVRLQDVLASQNVFEGELTLHAINDYRVKLPAGGETAAQAVIAYERNGAPMSRRDKGSAWLIFDYDSDAALRTETIYAVSIWQLDRITVSR